MSVNCCVGMNLEEKIIALEYVPRMSLWCMILAFVQLPTSGAFTSLSIRGMSPNDKLSCYTVSRSSTREEGHTISRKVAGSVLGRTEHTFDGPDEQTRVGERVRGAFPGAFSFRPSSLVSIHLQSNCFI